MSMNQYRDISLKKADNGGYIVCYSKYSKSTDAYDGMRYTGEGKEVFEKGADALKRLDELHGEAKEYEEEMEAEDSSGKSVDIKIKAKQ